MKSPPDAVHVGFSKCASTFLQRFFAHHPDIHFVDQSHFFAPFDFSSYDQGAADYLKLFEGANPGQVTLESDEHIILPLFHPVLAAAATTLESVAEVADRIRKINQEAKIIMVVRGQVSLIVSRYSEYVLGGGKLAFDSFVQEFLCCSTDGINYYQNFYAKIAAMLFDVFGQANVLVLTQEELSADEDATIGALCRFLGIRNMRPDLHDAISRRVGLSHRGMQVMKRLNRLIVRRQEMSSRKAQVRVPYLLYKVLQRSIREVDYRLPKTFKGDKKKILSDDVRSRIQKTFADDNKQLSSLLGRDLTQFGY